MSSGAPSGAPFEFPEPDPLVVLITFVRAYRLNRTKSLWIKNFEYQFTIGPWLLFLVE